MATVLVIEDNATNMTLAAFLLRSAGHAVLSARDAEAGLALARDEQPDLVLMDIQLPGMDGLEATALLKRNDATRAIPVIALTALAMKGDEERIRAAGCDGYIAKPMQYPDFLTTVAAQLGRTMSPNPAGAGHPARILIVDDEPQDRLLLKVLLAAEGHLALTAAGGAAALDMVAAEPPDLILLDLVMADIDGYQVADQLKGNPATRNIPVILVSALGDRETRLRGLLVGAEDILTKPVDRAELCARVRNLLRLKAHGDSQDTYSKLLEGEVGSSGAALVESERLYRSTFDAAPVGIVHADLDGHWLRVNQRLAELLGYSREELQNRFVLELIESDQGAGETEAFRSMASGALGRHVLDEKRYRRRDGSFMWARVNIAVHSRPDGRPRHFILVIEDITERRALEAQLRQASKMDAIGRLAAGVAHDFNNLLAVILGCAELVASDAVTANRHGDDLGEISKAARRAAGLTQQLLAFSRQQVLLAAPLDVNRLITDMAGMLGRLIGKDIEVALSLAPELSLALVDRSQLEQVMMNLVVNARDAMPDGGKVTIATATVELETSSFPGAVVPPGPYVMLAITDTGSGMSKETERRLFEPFFTTKEIGHGTGLGLSTTYGIVKQSKGFIWVHSELGRGTTFKVYLPCASAG